MSEVRSLDTAADRRADSNSYRYIALFVLLSWITLSITSHIETIKDGDNDPAIQHWLVQFSSHITILIVTLIIPPLLTKYPINRENWLRAAAVVTGGFIVFTVAHILMMVGIRKLLWPLVLEGQYDFGLADPINWIYEMQKDAYTFLLLISVFWFARLQARQKLEADGRREEATESGRITLTTGGRINLIHADDVRIAKAAANYVEIHTQAKDLLVRMTLRELETLLSSAGDNHIRIHRSCLVHKGDVSEVAPNGDGSATVTLKNGTALQASRSYRAGLASAFAPHKAH